MRCVLWAILLVLSSLLYAVNDTIEQIEQRIKPLGSVHIEEQSQPINVNPPAVKEEGAGQKIYERYCVVCHRDGLVGAPKFRDEGWKSRLSGKTIEELVRSALKGLNAMPAKGTCYECNEEDIKAAVEYMLPKS
jgi:cytochrome c5